MQMSKCQHKNTINSRKDNILLPEPIYPMTTRPEHSNTAKPQEDELKNSLVKMVEVLKEEVKNFLKNWGKGNEKIGRISKSLKECQENQKKNKKRKEKHQTTDRNK